MMKATAAMDAPSSHQEMSVMKVHADATDSEKNCHKIETSERCADKCGCCLAHFSSIAVDGLTCEAVSSQEFFVQALELVHSDPENLTRPPRLV